MPVAAALVLAILATPITHGAEESSAEYGVKAAYILKFVPFVTWPEGTFETDDSPVILGILGESPVTRELKRLATARSTGRELELRYLQESTAAADCHILFVGTSLGQETVLEVLDVVSESPVLTVSEIPEFSRIGGIITFVIRGPNVRFQINHESAVHAGLELSSKLLELAELVKSSPDQAGGNTE